MAPGDWPFVPPMKAVPAEAGPIGDDWLAELKWDGMRLQAHCIGPATDRRFRLFSANGRDRTSAFPELAGLVDAVPGDAVLDGEVVVFSDGRPDFGRLQHRMHVDEPTTALLAEHPVVFLAFDLLMYDGHDLCAQPVEGRRRLLAGLLDEAPSWRVPAASDDADALLALADARDLEGIVVKRRDSIYRPGERAPSWRKIKIRRHQEFVVGGWIESRTTADTMGSLAVGVWEDGRLVFCGSVGSGLGDVARRRIADAVVERSVCPFDGDLPRFDRPVHWIEPTLVVEVAYGEWPEGGPLRHPALLGVRDDRDPADVVRERPPG